MNVREYSSLPEQLSKALQGELPGLQAIHKIYPNLPRPNAPSGNTIRLSAVLMLLFPKQENWHILCIQRTEDGHAHSGQISFPGGKHEQEDENLLQTALREAYEEVGLLPGESIFIGELSPLYISVSNFQVYPFLAYCTTLPEWHINKTEVYRTLEIPLSDILNPDNQTNRSVKTAIPPYQLKNVNGFLIDEQNFIWGATAIMLSELEIILRNLQ